MATTEKLTLTVEEAGTLLGISRSLAFEAVCQNRIPHIRIGKRILVPRVALEKMLAEAGATGPNTANQG